MKHLAGTVCYMVHDRFGPCKKVRSVQLKIWSRVNLVGFPFFLISLHLTATMLHGRKLNMNYVLLLNVHFLFTLHLTAIVVMEPVYLTDYHGRSQMKGKREKAN